MKDPEFLRIPLNVPQIKAHLKQRPCPESSSLRILPLDVCLSLKENRTCPAQRGEYDELLLNKTAFWKHNFWSVLIFFKPVWQVLFAVSWKYLQSAHWQYYNLFQPWLLSQTFSLHECGEGDAEEQCVVVQSNRTTEIWDVFLPKINKDCGCFCTRTFTEKLQS